MDVPQQSQPRSSMARASGFEPEDQGSIPCGASNYDWYEGEVDKEYIAAVVRVWYRKRIGEKS